jgi:DNA (cytosine-5)-methyltransferase 1
MMFSAVSLFAGCGGSDLGMRAAGIDPIWSNEIDPATCEIFDRVTKQKTMNVGDIRTFDRFPSADILVGCYPCTGYSQAGRRNNQDGINFLYQEYDRVLRKLRPLAFIVENVNGMRFSQNSHLLLNQLTRFRSAGYRVSWAVLDAKSFGLAQDRNRIFIVGIRSSERKTFRFPEPAYTPDGPKRYRTLRDVIWKYREAPEGSFNDEPFHWYYLSRNRRRTWDEQSCIVAHWRHVPLHPDSTPLVRIGPDHWEFDGPAVARRLSYLECAALQGFPKPEAFDVGTVSQRFRAIGNAVPPPLFQAVAKELVQQLGSSNE